MHCLFFQFTITHAQIHVTYFNLLVQIKNVAELFKIVDDYNVGDKIVLKVQRNNGVVEIPITLEESII